MGLTRLQRLPHDPYLSCRVRGTPPPVGKVSTFCVINYIFDNHSLFYYVTICILFRLSISVLNNAKIISLIVYLLGQDSYSLVTVNI